MSVGSGVCTELLSLQLVSFVYPDESHDHCDRGDLEWHKIGHMTLVPLPCSFQLYCHHRVVSFALSKIFVMKRIFYVPITDLIFVKLAMQGGKMPQKWRCLDFFQRSAPKTGSYWQKCRVLFVYIYYVTIQMA